MIKRPRNSVASGISVAICCAVLAASAQTPFKPAGVVSATDTQYPIHSVANGIVVLDVALDAGGTIKGAKVVRDIASLTTIATSAVQSWKFEAAAGKAGPEASVMRVVFVFRPPEYVAAGPNFGPVPGGAAVGGNNAPRYMPAGIVLAAPYPEYPVSAAAAGSVVLQVTVDRSGQIANAQVVRDLPPFTALAVSAAKKWHFQAAALNGQPVASNIAIAFVFAPLPTGK
jgi:TonB family protein